MPLCSIHLFSLTSTNDLPKLIHLITSSDCQILTLSRPIRWIINPTKIDTTQLLQSKWHLLLIVVNSSSSDAVLNQITSSIDLAHHYTQSTGIPTRLIKDFPRVNNNLLHPSSIPELTGSLKNPQLSTSSQSLALSKDLQHWIGTDPNSLPVKGAVSMLNFLSFETGKKQEYLKYGAAFAESIGSKRGGNAKLVGNIISDTSKSDGNGGISKESAKDAIKDSLNPAEDLARRAGKITTDRKWDEFALAHYPSLLHFGDMLASEDYQEVNRKHRVGSLFDTCILCTSELEIEDMLKTKAKL